ncbi:unnamed protein product [Acanthoscelides obtectus]|uniref:Uncharacterized protein n=1 Tax=Acanthoscelides obtectus TaxID=200917 RepID=A0A9P0MJ96_ACAOB|nr:unnamed protein product [Acanthoscelides obtectus]CAH2015180.1 unnamed protein product [Acanthoscelides obtectus]CAK1624239.1 hypothetical protein AOBTE_LOCUS2432 [Acanthoscelides obtectus]CAK1625118.1 hypothetical protein AOBTE_LOCUS2968 [Acanthoscelides obtectus]
MQYTSLHWPEPKDLRTAIMRLVCYLTDLMLDAEHSTNYNMDICWDDNEVGRITLTLILCEIARYLPPEIILKCNLVYED